MNMLCEAFVQAGDCHALADSFSCHILSVDAVCVDPWESSNHFCGEASSLNSSLNPEMSSDMLSRQRPLQYEQLSKAHVHTCSLCQGNVMLKLSCHSNLADQL